MAKRKTKKKVTRRRNKVGALAMTATSPLVKYGSIGVGFLLGNKINPAIDKAVGDAVDGKIVAGAQVGLGALLVFKKGKKTMLTTVAGGIALGSGLKRAMAEFGLGGSSVGGYGQVPVIGKKKVGGYGQVPVLGGYTPNQSLNGYTPNTGLPVHKQVMGSAGSGNGSGSGRLR